MSEESATLPPSWCWCRLGDIAEIKSGLAKGKRRSASDVVRQVPYLRVANVQRGFLDLSEVKSIEATETEITGLLLQPGDVLFNEGGDRDKLGRGWIWSGELGECIHQNHVFRARLLPEIEPRFISFYGNSAAQDYFLRSGKQTTNLASINREQLANLPVPTPPAAEQRRIVARMKTLSARVSDARAALNEVPELLKLYRQSVLAAAFRGDLTADWRASQPDAEPATVLLDRIQQERRLHWEAAELARMKSPPRDDRWKAKYQEPEAVDDSDLPELPDGWAWTNLEEIGSLITSGSRDWSKYYGRGTDTFIMAQNVRPGRLDFTAVRQRVDPPVSDRDRERSQVRVGDLLFTIVGASTGDVCPVIDELPGHYVCQSVALVRLCLPATQGWVLRYFLSAGAGRKLLDEVIYGQGRPHLGFDDLKRLPIPLAPLAEQTRAIHRVAAYEASTGAVTSMVEAAREELGLLDQAILSKAFRGELVPQDPNDEPASALLDRIRAERQAEGKGRSARSQQGRLGGLD